MSRKLANVVVAAFFVLATLAVDTTTASNRLDLIRLLSEKPWLHLGYRAPQDGSNSYDSQEQHSNEDQGIPFLEDDDLRASGDKRSAIATAMNAGRRRRQPTPALGVLNDVGSFFDSLRDNLETLASLSPQQRALFFQDTPSVVASPVHSSSGGGGIQKLHALRPLRPSDRFLTPMEYTLEQIVMILHYSGLALADDKSTHALIARSHRHRFIMKNNDV